MSDVFGQLKLLLDRSLLLVYDAFEDGKPRKVVALKVEEVLPLDEKQRALQTEALETATVPLVQNDVLIRDQRPWPTDGQILLQWQVLAEQILLAFEVRRFPSDPPVHLSRERELTFQDDEHTVDRFALSVDALVLNKLVRFHHHIELQGEVLA